MGRCLSDHVVVLCKVRLMGAWIKKREMVNGGKLRALQYMEGYARCLESKRVE